MFTCCGVIYNLDNMSVTNDDEEDDTDDEHNNHFFCDKQILCGLIFFCYLGYNIHYPSY